MHRHHVAPVFMAIDCALVCRAKLANCPGNTHNSKNNGRCTRCKDGVVLVDALVMFVGVAAPGVSCNFVMFLMRASSSFC